MLNRRQKIIYFEVLVSLLTLLMVGTALTVQSRISISLEKQMPVYNPALYNPNYPFGPITQVDTNPGFDQNRTTFAGLTRDQVQAYYTQLQTAYITLTMGNKPVTVSYEGKSVTYSPVDAPRLKNLLDEAAQILGYGRQRRALSPVFR